MATTQDASVEWQDVQGIVLRGYGKHPFTANLFLTIDDPKQAREWLANAADRVTTAVYAMDKTAGCYLNVAFTQSGVRKLGLSDETMGTFPTAFVEGMASANRSRILGDDEASDPGNWLWGGPNNAVDLVVLIFTKDAATLEQATRAEQSAMKGLSPKYGPITTQLSADFKEHFGFHDSISQPIIEGSPIPQKAAAGPTSYAASNVIKAGEFVLGYLNEYEVLPDPLALPAEADPNHTLATVELTPGRPVPDLGRNGSYLVVRHVRQHVPQLWNYLDTATKDAQGQGQPYDRDKLGAKLIGRWASGAPMTLAPDQDDPALSRENNFVYGKADPDGMGCPFGAAHPPGQPPRHPRRRPRRGHQPHQTPSPPAEGPILRTSRGQSPRPR